MDAEQAGLRPGLDEREAIQLQGRLQETQIEITELQEQVKRLTARSEELIVRAPIDGVVATFQLRQKLLRRPVSRGDRLLDVMDTDCEWRLELDVPEKRLGHLRDGGEKYATDELPVQFVMATHPEVTYAGTVQHVNSRTEVSPKNESVLRVRIAISSAEIPEDQRRIGADVKAKIDCGERSLGYCLFGDVIEFVQREWWW